MAQTMQSLHAILIVACYFEFYEEGEVEHINGPTHPSQQQKFPLAPFYTKLLLQSCQSKSAQSYSSQFHMQVG